MKFFSLLISFCFCLGLFVTPSLKADESADFFQETIGVSSGALAMRLLKGDEYRSEVPLHGRRRFIIFTPEEERKIGEVVLEQEKGKGTFYDSKEDMDRVTKIAKGILDVLPEDLRPPLKVFLMNTEEVNAACVIGGILFVTRGALKYFPDDAELAFVIGHEYGHAIARHGGEGVTKGIMAELGKEGAFFVIDKKVQDDSPVKAFLLKLGTSLSARYFFELPYSRTMENEADALGIVYLKKAGYDADAALRAMRRLGKLSGDEKEGAWKEFLSTHPSDKKRLKHLEDLVKMDDEALLEMASEDDSKVNLDWHLEAGEMLNDLRIVQKPCKNATGKVLLIPGIFMKDSEDYLPALEKTFSASDLEVLEWKAVKKFSWRRAMYRAKILANYLAGKLMQEQPEELAKTTIVGHSLGSEVIVKACKVLADQGIKVKRVILLGSAVHFDSENLEACEKVSQEPPLLVFNPNDKILKYAFFYYEKTPALGLLGSKSKMERLREFRMPPPVKDVKESQPAEEEEEECQQEDENDSKYSDDMPLEISDGFLKSHSALQYIAFLEQILLVKESLETVKIDHQSIAQPVKIKKALPGKGSKMLETYHDWEFRVYPISIPWPKKKKKTEDTPAEEKPPKGFFIIRNPYGQICHWGTNQEKAKEHFEEIKKKIDEQLSK